MKIGTRMSHAWIAPAVAAFAMACSSSNSTKTAQQTGSSAAAGGNITVAGCLARADETPGSVGTGGSATATPPASTTPPAPAERFVVRQAQPAGTNPSSAVGTAGSGSSYTLVGDATELRSHAGQQVEVLGRMDTVAPDAGGQRLIVTSVRTVADTCANP